MSIQFSSLEESNDLVIENSELKLNVKMQQNQLNTNVNIANKNKIDVGIVENENILNSEVQDSQETLDVNFELGTILVNKKYPDYEGEYNVIPKVTSQVLHTKNKSMLDDVTIFQIPYSAVSNPSGGQTITIGLE